jgi:hypothetical protein
MKDKNMLCVFESNTKENKVMFDKPYLNCVHSITLQTCAHRLFFLTVKAQNSKGLCVFVACEL